MKALALPSLLATIFFGGACARDSRDDTTSLDHRLLLARSGWVVSSNVASGEPPALAVDGDSSSRFSTGRGMQAGDSLQIDLGSSQLISRVLIDSRGSPGDHPRGYQIFLSDDATDPGSPIASGAPTDGLVEVALDPASGRYLTIVQTGSSGSWWSVHELNVYSHDTGSGSPEVPRAGWSSLRTGSAPGEPLDQLRDGNPDTRWTTGEGMSGGQYVELALGGCYAVDRVVMDSGRSSRDYARGYRILLSNDGSSWGNPVASESPAQSPVDARFSPTAGRWIRIEQTGTSDAWWSIHELYIHGAGSSACGAAPPPPPPSGTIKLVSWNTANAADPSGQVTELGPQRADVIFLQEVGAGPRGEYLAALNAYEARVGSGKTWTGSSDGSVYTWREVINGYRVADLGQNSWPNNSDYTWNPHRTAGAAVISFGGTTVSFLGTHLDWHPTGDMTNHIENRDRFLEWASGFSGRIVAGGDLNAWTAGGSSWEGDEQRVTLSRFTERWRDACLQLDSELSCNHGMPTNGGWTPDHVFHSSDLRTVSYRVLDRGGLSDHRMLVLELALQ